MFGSYLKKTEIQGAERIFLIQISQDPSRMIYCLQLKETDCFSRRYERHRNLKKSTHGKGLKN